ncbi:MAG: LysM domain-containing protein [Bacillota bacterium]
MGLSIHQVRPGETMYGIAQRYGVPLSLLLRMNPAADPRNLRPGMLIWIPEPGGYGPGGYPPGGVMVHRVSPGETLWQIAAIYRVPIRAIVEFNRLRSPDWIFPGQTLLIPVMPH